MTRFTEEMHSAVGALGQEAIGRPGIVVVVPDNYLPEPRPEGVGGFGDVAAGGAGTRSEIAIACQTVGTQPDRGLEVSDIWIRSGTAGTQVEFSSVAGGTTFSGYTNQGVLAGDTALGITVCRVFTKNTAAAIAATRRFTTNASVTAGLWVKVPGIFRLRGAPGQNIIIVRPTTDNQSIGCMFAFRELEKRKL